MVSLDKILGAFVKNPFTSRRGFIIQQVTSLLAQDPKPGDKAPIPNVSAERSADLHKVYEKEMALTAKDKPKPEKVKEAIDKLLNDALGTKNDPAAHYTLLTWAFKQAKEFADFPNAFKSVDELDKAYTDQDFKPWKWKSDVLDDARKKSPKGEQLEALVNADMDLVIYEMSLGQQAGNLYAEAIKAAKTTNADAKALKNKPMEDKAAALQNYATDLDKDRKDALTLTKFKYFILGDSSEEVLKMLSNSADGNLRKLAGLQVIGGKDAGNYFEYFETAYSAANDGGRLAHEKRDLQSKALDFYKTAISKAEGAAKTTYERKGEKRASELEKALAGAATVGTIDLLKMIDLKKDVVEGTWKLDNGSLISPIAPKAIVQIPYIPPDEYDLQLTVECLSAPETGALAVGLAGREWQTEVQFNCEGRMYFFEQVDGKPGTGQYRVEGKYMKMNQPVDLKCAVRKDKITVFVDGKQILELKDYAKRVSVHPFWKVPSTQTLFFGEQNTQYRFKQIKLTTVSGRGSPLQK